MIWSNVSGELSLYVVNDGLKHIMEMVTKRKMGLMSMMDMGLIQYAEEDSEEDDGSYETPENEVEVAEVEWR